MPAQREEVEVRRPDPSSKPGNHRLMIPREHGAYAELLFPIVTVLLGGTPTGSTWLLAISACACFLANEPILVVFGQRGTRSKREDSGRAKRMLLLLFMVAVATGIPGLLQAPQAAQYAVGLPLLLGVGLVMMAVQGLERSMFGETMAAGTLSTLAVPLGLTAGLSLTASLAVALIWLVASLLGTSVVRLTVARTKAKTDQEFRQVRTKQMGLVAVCAVVIAVGAGAPYTPRVSLWVLAGAIPVAVVVAALAIGRPTARRLRMVGWILVLANLTCLVAVVTTLKIIQDFNAVEPTLPFPMF